jgi:hypothetical protein
LQRKAWQGRGETGNFVISGFYLIFGKNYPPSSMSSVTKQAVLSRLGAYSNTPFKILVEDQDVHDIINGVIQKHEECQSHYDAIYPMFDGPGDWDRVGQRLWDFCKRQLTYSVETIDWQLVKTPATLMKQGFTDCKGYALFCAGVIDAMKRAGEPVDWCYCFASYELFNSAPGHVFVILFPDTPNEMWLDPVLRSFDARRPRPIWKRKYWLTASKSRKKRIAGIGACVQPNHEKLARIGLSSAEQNLLDEFDEYSEGVADAVSTAQSTGVFNTICLVVLVGASTVFPVIAAAIAILKTATSIVSNNFGVGSLGARLLSDLSSNILTAPVTIVETLINGRTYQSDQYRAGQYYDFYVQGNASVNALNKVADGDVAPAMKWFMDRLGVFISGAQHIDALTQSPAAYMALYGVNSYTTTDANRVNAAYNVASKYFVKTGVAGAWANTLGVYDMQLAQIATAANETIEAAAAQANYTNVYSAAAESGPAPVAENPNGITIPIIPLMLVLAGAILFIQPSTK